MDAYQIESRIGYSEVDENLHLDLCGFIKYFQDCSTFQTEDLGIGFSYLVQRNCAWIMESWQILVDRFPRVGERVTIATWPTDFTSIFGLRNFTMKDEKGAYLARAGSIWVYMDMSAGRPVRVPAELQTLYGTIPPLDMDYAPRKIALPKVEGIEHPIFYVPYISIDSNHHVNNSQYIKMAQEFVPASFPIWQMRAEYKASAKKNDQILPITYDMGDKFYVTLCNPMRKPYVIVEYTARKEN